MLLNRERALDVMERHGLDALVATLPENVYYLSDVGENEHFLLGAYGSTAAILPRDEGLVPTFLVGELHVPYLLERPTWMPEVRMIGGIGGYVPEGAQLSAAEQQVADFWQTMRPKSAGTPNRQEALAAALRELGLQDGRLGFDDVRVMLELGEAGIARTTASDALNVFREIRLVKTPAELRLLKKASQLNDTALAAAANLLGEGVLLREVRECWATSLVLQGAVPGNMSIGGYDRPWPTAPSSYRVKEGDHVTLDGCSHYAHYWADVGRIGCVGAPSARLEHLWGVVLDIHVKCVALLRPGESTEAIKEHAFEVAPAADRDGVVPLLHTLGVELYDMPQRPGEVEREDFMLEPGVVVNLECPFLEFPWGEVHLEDTYVITESGSERLGTLPQELFRST
jgi:Xaa-Pro dipeptidase